MADWITEWIVRYHDALTEEQCTISTNAVPLQGYPISNLADSDRQTEFRTDSIGDINIDIEFPTTAYPGRVAILNHNLKTAGVTSIAIYIGASFPPTTLLDEVSIATDSDVLLHHTVFALKVAYLRYQLRGRTAGKPTLRIGRLFVGSYGANLGATSQGSVYRYIQRADLITTPAGIEYKRPLGPRLLSMHIVTPPISGSSLQVLDAAMRYAQRTTIVSSIPFGTTSIGSDKVCFAVQCRLADDTVQYEPITTLTRTAVDLIEVP